jgi:hypothetical protein
MEMQARRPGSRRLLVALLAAVQLRWRLASKLVPFQENLEWNFGHRRHLPEQDAPRATQQKHKAKWAAPRTSATTSYVRKREGGRRRCARPSAQLETNQAIPSKNEGLSHLR